MKNVYRFFFLLILFNASCRSDRYDITEGGYELPPVENQFEVGFMAQVINTSNRAIDGATISVNNNELGLTNDQGFIFVPKAILAESGSLILIEHPNYLTSGETLYPSQGEIDIIDIELLQQIEDNLVNPETTGWNVSSLGTSMTAFFSIDALRDKNNIVQNEAVQFLFETIDLDGYGSNKLLPASNMGINSKGLTNAIQHHHVFAIDAHTVNNAQLLLNSETEVQVNFDISEINLASFAETIPLWHFDEKLSTWIEKGLATRTTGNRYQGIISELGFWSAAQNADFIKLKLNIRSVNNEEISGLRSKLINENKGIAFGTISNYNGHSTVIIEKNIPHNLEIYDACSNLIYSDNIEAFGQSTEIDVIIPIDSNIITVQGMLIDCDSLPIQNGYISVAYSNKTIYAFTNKSGLYKTTFISCTQSGDIPTNFNIEISAVDIENNLNSFSGIYDLSTTNSFPTFKICNNPSTLFSLNWNGETTYYNFVNLVKNDEQNYDIVAQSDISIGAENFTYDIFIGNVLDPNGTANYINNCTVFLNKTNADQNFYNSVDGNYNTTFNLSTVPLASGFVQGTFNSSVFQTISIDGNIDTATVDISGEFSLFKE